MDCACSTALTPAVSETEAAILDVLRAAPRALHPREIAVELGAHVNTVRQHLTILETIGMVGRARDGEGPGRPRVVYRPARAPQAAERFVATCTLARFLAAYVVGSEADPGGTGDRIGREWGRHLVSAPPFARTSAAAALDSVVTLLRRLGLGDTDHEQGTRSLRVSPDALETLASEFPELVQGLYLGIVAGALDALGAPLRITAVERSHDGSYVLPYALDSPASGAREVGEGATDRPEGEAERLAAARPFGPGSDRSAS